MPVNAGHVGYSSVPPGASETCPLLIPESDSLWRPMTREELEAAAGPVWRNVRCYLGHHTCHFYRHHNKEPPAGCDALEMVAGVCVLSAAGRPVDGGADRGFRGHVR